MLMRCARVCGNAMSAGGQRHGSKHATRSASMQRAHGGHDAGLRPPPPTAVECERCRVERVLWDGHQEGVAGPRDEHLHHVVHSRGRAVLERKARSGAATLVGGCRRLLAACCLARPPAAVRRCPAPGHRPGPCALLPRPGCRLTVRYSSSGSAGQPSRASSAAAIWRRSTSAPALSLYAPTPPGMSRRNTRARATTSAGNSSPTAGCSSSCVQRVAAQAVHARIQRQHSDSMLSQMQCYSRNATRAWLLDPRVHHPSNVCTALLLAHIPHHHTAPVGTRTGTAPGGSR